MKKGFQFVSTLTIATCLAVSLGVGISAKNTKGEVAYGTAKVDGVLDEAYMKSTVTESVRDNVFFYGWAPEGTVAENQDTFPARATSYFLWDEDYFYTCTVVKDPTPIQKSADYYLTPYPWMDDSVEGYYVRDGKMFTLHTDGYGVTVYAYNGDSANGKAAWADVPAIGNFGEPVFSNTDCESLFATTRTEDGYIVETALKLKDGATYSAGEEIKFALQVNDIKDKDSADGYAVGSQDPYNQGLDLTLGEKPAETEAPVTTAPAEEGGTTQGTTESTGGAPQTSDLGIVFAVVAVTSGAALASIKLTGEKKIKK